MGLAVSFTLSERKTMIVKICAVDRNSRLAHVCLASDRVDSQSNRGRMLVHWFSSRQGKYRRPSLGQSYTVAPQIEWGTKDGKPVIIHGYIDSFQSIEEGSNANYNRPKAGRRIVGHHVRSRR